MVEIEKEILDKRHEKQIEIEMGLDDGWGVVLGKRQARELQEEMAPMMITKPGQTLKHGASGQLAGIWLFEDQSADVLEIEIKRVDEIMAEFSAAKHARWCERIGKEIEVGLCMAFDGVEMDHPRNRFSLAKSFVDWLIRNRDERLQFVEFEVDGDDVIGHLNSGATLTIDIENPLSWHFSSADAK